MTTAQKLASLAERSNTELAAALRTEDDEDTWTWAGLANTLGNAEKTLELWTRSGGSLGTALALAQ